MIGDKFDWMGLGIGVLLCDLCVDLVGILLGFGFFLVCILDIFLVFYLVWNLFLIYFGCKMMSLEFGVRIVNFD